MLCLTRRERFGFTVALSAPAEKHPVHKPSTHFGICAFRER